MTSMPVASQPLTGQESVKKPAARRTGAWSAPTLPCRLWLGCLTVNLDPAAEQVLHERIPQEAMRLIEAAAEGSMTLRVAGSIAVRFHGAAHAPLLDAMGRRLFRDIDFWGYSKQQSQLERMFEKDGYMADPTIWQAHEWGVKRLIFEHPETHVKVDVFMDELVMSHTIEFKGRLEMDSPTICLADLLLSKLQIHEVTENDLMDMSVLLAEHDFGSQDRESIDLDHIARILGGDWGYWYTTLDNIAKCDEALDRYSAMSPDLTGIVRKRLSLMREKIESAPKSTRWKLRAKVGTRTRWYEEVNEVGR